MIHPIAGNANRQYPPSMGGADRKSRGRMEASKKSEFKKKLSVVNLYGGKRRRKSRGSELSLCF